MHIIFVYLGILVGIFFEGEMVMVSAVIAAHHQYLNLWVVIIIGFLATYSADLFYFFIGRKRGKGWLEENGTIQKRIDKHPVLIFISYRFLYGLRTIVPIVFGASRINTFTFIIFSALSTLLWTLVVTVVGYSFSSVIESRLSHIQDIEKYFIVAFVVIGTILFFLHRVRKKKRKKI